jgi:hypothetical protein
MFRVTGMERMLPLPDGVMVTVPEYVAADSEPGVTLTVTVDCVYACVPPPPAVAVSQPTAALLTATVKRIWDVPDVALEMVRLWLAGRLPLLIW